MKPIYKTTNFIDFGQMFHYTTKMDKIYNFFLKLPANKFFVEDNYVIE